MSRVAIRLRLLVLSILFLSFDWEAFAQTFAPVEVQRPESGQQQKLRRSLSLLSRSRLDRSNTIRIAFYGQSFVQSTWWTNLINEVRRSYPHASIVAENRAFDRHPTPQLIRLAESQLYPFRPDLVVLMASGDHHETRRLVRSIRERTSADVILMTEPLRQVLEMDEPTRSSDFPPDPLHFPPTSKTWHSFLNYSWLPFVAEDQDAALIDVRSGWKAYLRSNRLEPRALIPNGEQFSPMGHFVTEQLIRPWFEFPAWMTSEDPWDGDRVSSYEVPRDLEWKAGTLRLEFEGYRAEVIVSQTFAKPVKVILDGKSPSEIKELRIHGLASSYPGTSWPVLLRAGNDVPLARETWTAKIYDVSTNAGGVRFKFSIEGSTTGPDGEGSSDIEFLSKSKRVSIQPQDWNLELGLRRGQIKLRDAFSIQWSELELGRDDLGGKHELGGQGQHVIPLATGLRPGRHVLELRDEKPGDSGILGVRVYRPALKVQTKRKK